RARRGAPPPPGRPAPAAPAAGAGGRVTARSVGPARRHACDHHAQNRARPTSSPVGEARLGERRGGGAWEVGRSLACLGQAPTPRPPHGRSGADIGPWRAPRRPASPTAEPTPLERGRTALRPR